MSQFLPSPYSPLLTSPDSPNAPKPKVWFVPRLMRMPGFILLIGFLPACIFAQDGPRLGWASLLFVLGLSFFFLPKRGAFRILLVFALSLPYTWFRIQGSLPLTFEDIFDVSKGRSLRVIPNTAPQAISLLGTVGSVSVLQHDAPFILNTKSASYLCKIDPGAPKIFQPFLERGAQIKVTGIRLEPPVALGSGQPDWMNIYRSQGIKYKVNYTQIEVIAPPGHVMQILNQSSNYLFHTTNRFFHPKAQALILALITGERSLLDTQEKEIFKESGLFHFISISGQHISLMALIFSALLGAMGIPLRFANLLVCLLLLFYIPLTGSPACVLRASLAFILFSLALNRQTQNHTLHHFSWTALICLVAYPASWSNPGFLLSFSSTLIIIRYTPLLNTYMKAKDWPAPIKIMVSCLILSVVLSMGSWPILSRSFLQITPSGIISNLGVVVLAPLILGGAYLTYALSLCAPLAQLAGTGTSFFCGVLYQWADICANIPGGQLLCKPLPIVTGLLAYLLVILWPEVRQRSQIKKTFAFLFFVFCLCISVPKLYSYSDQKISVHFLPVGQGDASLIVKGKQAILIDTGPASAWKFIQNHLTYHDISTLHTIILSHWDKDHSGGLPRILSYIKPERVIIPSFSADDPWQSTVVGMLHEAGIPLYRSQCGDTLFSSSHFTLRTLSPCPPFSSLSSNAQSLVVLGSLYKNDFLWTGDVDRKTERALLNKLPPSASLRALKLGHHGAKNSNDPLWLRYWKPQVALISAGLPSPYGHPHPDVLEEMNKQKIPWFHTMLSGTVIFECTQTDCQETPFLEPYLAHRNTSPQELK